VAEGIESVMQLRQLEMLRCDVAQGYLFSRPLDGRALCQWMEEHEASRLENLWDGEAERVFRTGSPFGA
jgi:sensor c-di-GMP phosphodiesterase-like protein